MSNSKKSWLTWNTVGGFLVGLLALFVIFRPKTKAGTVPNQPKAPVLNPDYPVSIITRELTKKGYSTQMAHMWVAISRHETGDGTSRLYKEANNLFGMKQPQIRPTESMGPDNGYASFLTFTNSVWDQILYMEHFNYPKNFNTVADLVAFMKSKGYFTDSYENYYRGVMRFY